VVIDLVKNSGSAAAVAAGCVAARGRHFIFLDSDLQLDPEELPTLMEAFDRGMDLVNGVRRTRRDPLMRRVASRIVNVALRRWSGAQVVDLGCTFKVARGELIRGLAPGPHRPLNPVHLAAVARDCANVTVTHHPRSHGRSGWGFTSLVSLAIDSVLGLSRHPFQTVGLVSLFVTVLVTLRIVVALLTPRAIFPPIGAGLLLSFAVLSLAIIVGLVCLVGEYVLRTHRSIEGPPRYIVRTVWERPVGAAAAVPRSAG
jgi:undecaprenyl-phosphate 4-deoxy-4-formamido-L-arabinose transferase